MIKAQTRKNFKYFLPIQTRWGDNDAYGHVNNVVYLSLVDSVINEYLVKKGGLDINAGSWLGLMVSSNCQFWAPLEFPQMVECGLKVVRLGRTSVTYRVGIFGKDDDLVAASAEMIHCFVDRLTRRPIAMPTPLRNALEAILVPDSFL